MKRSSHTNFSCFLEDQKRSSGDDKIVLIFFRAGVISQTKKKNLMIFMKRGFLSYKIGFCFIYKHLEIIMKGHCFALFNCAGQVIGAIMDFYPNRHCVCHEWPSYILLNCFIVPNLKNFSLSKAYRSFWFSLKMFRNVRLFARPKTLT